MAIYTNFCVCFTAVFVQFIHLTVCILFDIMESNLIGGGCTAIKFKIDIVEQLKSAGFSSYRIRKEKLLGEGTLTKLRDGNTSIQLDVIDSVCALLNCQPGDLLEYVPPDDK